MTRTFGSSEAGKEERQRKILALHVRGMTTPEMAAQLKVKPRTIYRDLEELGHWLRQQNDRNQLYSLGEAFALAKEILREAWILYHRPPARDDNGRTQDDTLRKLWALDRIMKATQVLERLAGFGASRSIPPQPAVKSNGENEVASLIESLPEDEQIVLAKAIRHLESKDQSGNA
jgi:hypothetical protein